jgi:hypothetical protein
MSRSGKYLFKNLTQQLNLKLTIKHYRYVIKNFNGQDRSFTVGLLPVGRMHSQPDSCSSEGMTNRETPTPVVELKKQVKRISRQATDAKQTSHCG